MCVEVRNLLLIVRYRGSRVDPGFREMASARILSTRGGSARGAQGQRLHLAALTNITELLSPPYMPCTVPASPPLSSSVFSSDARRSKIHLKPCHRYYMHACNL
ncbi:unnamed protein product, partial [Musa textilis]